MSYVNVKPNRHRLAAIVGIGVIAATMARSGCGTPTAGAAAVVGDQRISEDTLNSEVQAVLTLQGLPATDSSNELARLKVEASLLNQAMKNLADSTEEVSAIEQRVGKIRQEIANEEQDNIRKQSETENRGEKLLTSSPEQLQFFPFIISYNSKNDRIF